MLTKETFAIDTLTKDDLRAFIKRYRNNIILFVREIIQLEPDANQIKILQSIQDDDYVTVSSGRGIGKSWTLSMVAIWTLATRSAAKVLIMSNTDAQSKSTLWAPLVTILKGSLIADWFDSSTELINFKGDRDTAFIKRLVWSENNIESVSGYHSENMIYLCDEASKYPNAVLDNLYASCTQSWNKMLLTSNPTRNTGYFFDTSNKDTWNFLEIDSRDSLHTDKGKIQELIDTYGADSDTVRIQVLGQFPRLSSESILNNNQINQTFSSVPVRTLDNHARVLGIDIGGGGDATCFVVRIGNKIEAIIKKQTSTKDLILQETQRIVVQYNIKQILFDKTGIGFFLLADIQQVVHRDVEVTAINFGESSPEPDCFNMRSWLYRRMRDWVSIGGIIGNRPDVKLQVQATECYQDDKGRLKLIPKAKISKEIGHSPDEADSIALTCGYRGDLLYTQISNKVNQQVINKGFMEPIGW